MSLVTENKYVSLANSLGLEEKPIERKIINVTQKQQGTYNRSLGNFSGNICPIGNLSIQYNPLLPVSCGIKCWRIWRIDLIKAKDSNFQVLDLFLVC